jgi:altronate dehydratase small subunit
MGQCREEKKVRVTPRAVIIDPQDNVATALADLEAGETLALRVGDRDLAVELIAPIPFGHKLSLAAVRAGAPVIKYGEIIGTATTGIQPGDHVHVHNLVSARGRGDLAGGGP